jgi:hypothetical protein
MTKAKRLALWGLVLSPVLLFPTAFLSARLWLNHHLKREFAFAGVRLHLENPLLGWDLDFSADSVALTAPRFGLHTGRVETDLRLWNSIASLKPSITLSAERMRIRVEPDSADSLERERRRKRGKAPSFPNVRIPVAVQVKAGRVEFAMGTRRSFEARGVNLYSQGPKGVVLEVSGLAVAGRGGDSALSDLGGFYRASARWFGTSLRYQLRAEDSAGNFVKLDGERRKRDLRVGKDSVDASLADFSAYASLFPGRNRIGSGADSGAGPRRRRGPPDFRDMALQGSLETGDHRTVRLHATFRSPAVWRIPSQAVELTGDFEDSLGHISIKSKGGSEEAAYLQGRFELPSLDSGFARAASGLTASLSGFTRNFRFRIGRRMLPGDAEIRRLRVLPGLVLVADVRTRDSSVFHGRAFRGPDSGSARGDSSWKCTFSGTVDPGETWVHAWVDTNVSFRHARVSGEAGRHGLKVEAWVRQPKAYGSAADSLYALQTINKSRYRLVASRVSGKEAVWPVTGQVEWSRRARNRTDSAAAGGAKAPTGRRRQVSLVFRTKHPRYGSAEYAMPGRGRMEVKAENLDGQKLPYARLAKLLSLHPVATGRFAWNWHARTGAIDAKADLTYNGHPLGMSARAQWDARTFAAEGLDLAFLESTLRLSGQVRLGGRQFWQMKKLGLADLADLSLSAGNFDAAGLSAILGEGYPVERGMLNGTLAYSDSSGFRGTYSVRDLELRQFRKRVSIPHLLLSGQGESLHLSMRTVSSAFPWLNDSLDLTVADVLGRDHGLTLEVRSDDGLAFAFKGLSRGFRDVDGRFALRGKSALLPGQAGEIRDVDVSGHFAAPFGRDLLKAMILDSASFSGRYAVPGLDTQSFRGTLSLREGRLRVPDLSASSRGGVTLTGEADCLLSRSPTVTARVRGGELALQWPGIQKLLLRDADATLRLDSSGLAAKATVGRAEFASSRPPVSMRGAVENLSLEYDRPRTPKGEKGASPAAAVIPQLKVDGKLRGFTFKHKIGFRELQKSIKTVKVDKRKKRVKPIDVQINLETAGSENRVETDVLRMVFVGDIAVKGVYPYTLLSGEFSALKGELGQTSQSYDITDFDLKWQNATVEEGRISVEGAKRLRADCKPDTKRTCNVYVKLAGRLDEMAFTYDSDCGGNTGATLEPSALINSVSSGCYSDEYVAGGGGGNYGEAVFALLEPTINEKLSSVGSTFSGGWIKRTSVTGIGTAVSGDTTGTMPLSVAVESKEKWGVSFKASAGYHAEKKVQNPWENKASAEWRPPLEKASGNSEWKRRVRDRVTLEASVETRPEEKVKEENRQVRKQVGIRYRFKFWDLW